MASIRSVTVLVLLGLIVATGCSRPSIAHARPVRVVAWDDAVPGQIGARPVPPAAPCRASQLRVAGTGFQFVPGVVGGTGAIALRNTGPGPCRLTGRPAVSLVGAPRAPAQRDVALPAQVPSFPEVDEPAAMLLALPSGATGTLSINWSNWCVPGATRSAKPQVPPSAVRISLGAGRGSLDVNYNAVPDCDTPGQPSTIGVRPFAPSPLPSTQPWTTANVKATIQPIDGGGARLTGKRGQIARFAVRLANTSATELRFHRCPLVVEDLAPSGPPEVHQLNCRSAGSIPSGGSLVFAMQIHVPASAPRGKNGLFWELDPTGAQYPEAVSGLIVSG
jgi:hypothetical protein